MHRYIIAAVLIVLILVFVSKAEYATDVNADVCDANKNNYKSCQVFQKYCHSAPPAGPGPKGLDACLKKAKRLQGTTAKKTKK